MKSALSLIACFIGISLSSQMLMGDFILGAEAGVNLGFRVSMPDAETVAYVTLGNEDIPRSVQVLEWNGNNWTPKGDEFIGDPLDLNLGIAIAMPNTNTIAIAAAGNDNSLGFVQVYDWNNGMWQQRGDNIVCQGKLLSWAKNLAMPDPNTIAVSGQTIGLGGSWSGVTQVFHWEGDAWTQKGEDIESSDTTHLYGNSVDMPSASTIAISAFLGSSDVIDIAKVYEWDGTNWVQKGNPITDAPPGAAYFPIAQMPTDNTIAVGVSKMGLPLGYAAVYDWDGSDWALRGEPMSYFHDFNASDSFGSDVSMPDENTLAVGDPENTYNPVTNTYMKTSFNGLTRVYNWDGSEWSVRADIYSEFPHARAGSTVSMGDGNHVAIGGIHAATVNGSQTGVVMVYQLDPVGIEEQEALTDFSLYPNPTSGTTTLEFQNVIEHAIITLYTIDGRIIDTQAVYGATRFNYELQEAPGVYFIQVSLPTGAQKTLRVIKL